MDAKDSHCSHPGAAALAKTGAAPLAATVAAEDGGGFILLPPRLETVAALCAILAGLEVAALFAQLITALVTGGGMSRTIVASEFLASVAPTAEVHGAIEAPEVFPALNASRWAIRIALRLFFRLAAAGALERACLGEIRRGAEADDGRTADRRSAEL